MMRASTKASIASADVVINVPLKSFGSLDWRRSAELIAEGYKAAEAMRDQLLPLAVSEADYEQWQQSRQGRRRTDAAGAGVRHRGRLQPRRSAAARCAAGASTWACPSTSTTIELDLAELSGLDRYETITWHIVSNDARRSRAAGQGTRETVRAAVPDARRESREHDLERLPHHA